ncbi:MBL fold metallo-hydrolase [Paraburkholderia sp.]|uniref:MBL fold metallo-hydrolase n=1 Tax=Paraburkholderia sp. TaxID=1926495 RepID=UPI00238E820D|nr:MBL fold metallo-hydrolase [Paraburkholderia sp.]MDE1179137.1 MBL fold metallo-hydrolase [Paraburkholderia sp.]
MTLHAGMRAAHASDERPVAMPSALHVPVPRAVAQGVYVMQGSGDAVTPANRGVVANNGFVVGPSGVTVIDTGASYRYGRAMIDAIRQITPLPVQLVILTHQAPEFVFGASAFRDRDVPILAHRRAATLIRERCAICLKNLQRTLGDDEMAGSRVTVPERTVDETTHIEVGGRQLDLLYFGPASTPGDLAVLDSSSGVLFAGALVNAGRIPELRNENIPGWLDALDTLRTVSPRVIVPGFGPLVTLDPTGRNDDVARTGIYLRELDAAVRQAYGAGTGLTDAMHGIDLPEFRRDKLYPVVQAQNVQRLYLQLEKQ